MLLRGLFDMVPRNSVFLCFGVCSIRHHLKNASFFRSYSFRARLNFLFILVVTYYFSFVRQGESYIASTSGLKNTVFPMGPAKIEPTFPPLGQIMIYLMYLL